MDSSPDLSLKLRRGSGDSRDNFYMDFAQGIDSDIEEVDNSLLQQQATAPPLQDDMDYVGIPPPPPPLMGIVVTQPQVLPTLSEHDDLPSPPPSPTSSILEMMPPPPLSPTFHRKSNSRDQSSSPPIETEDEEEDDDDREGEINGHDADIEETPEEAKADELNNIIPTEYTNGIENGAAVEGDGDESISPPSRVTTPPNQFLYSSNNDDENQLPQPMQGSTPSISPSPPVTPPPCPELTSISKIVSPPPVHISQIPPLTSPSDSDQSQPDSPTSSKSQQAQDVLMPTIPHPPPEYETPDYDEPPIRLPNLPTDYEESGDEYIDLTKAKKEAEQEEIKSYYDEEFTTIPTSHGNGYSGSYIVGQPIEQIVEKQLISGVGSELEEESLHEEEDEHYLRGEEERTETQTPLSDTKPGDLDESSSEPQSIHEREEEKSVVEEERGEGRPSVPGTPTSQISQPSQTTPTPTISGSPKRKGSITTAESVSRVPSRSASRSGSIRGSSRAGSVAGSSVVSVPTSITSGKVEIVSSPPTSIKCIRSPQDSIRSRSSIKMSRSPSQKSLSHKITSPQLSGRLQSPPEGDSAPIMPSPPLMRSPPSQVKSPALMHSPPTVTSPPKVYSPLIISSPPIRKADSPTETASPERDSEPERDVISDALPTTCSFVAASDTLVTSAAVITDDDDAVAHDGEQPKQQTMQQPVVTSTQVFSVARHQISSHHHYHLPHQFQHPHHQNHHTHSHGAVPVSTPTVPASYTSSNLAQESRHKRAASSSGDEGLSKSSSPPPTATVTPSTTTNLVVCSETSSHIVVSPVKLSAARIRDSGLQHRVTIDESTLTGALGGGGSDEGNGSGPPSPGSSLEQQLTSDDRHTNHLTLMYHSSQLSNLPVLPAIKRTHRPSFMYPPMPRIRAGDALATLFSALYGKLLVVMGVAFPMAEVISTYIPPSFYEVYYLYLYIGSMIFLLFMYATLLWGRPKIPANIASPTKSSAKTRSTSVSESMDESDAESNSMHNKRLSTTITMARRPSLLSPLGRQHHYGSFYLRMGAVAFGIGSMIYSGLEFGQYFELNPDTKCHNVLLALTPATRMAFIFIQMYFIFLNNEQIKVYRYKIVARFGLMHMIGTNLAVWLNVLIQETKHEILTFYNPENRTLRISHRIPGHSRAHSILASSETSAHLRVTRGLKGPYQIFECRRTNILGTLVQDASPFLFPCTIEYSLICAAILYVMWKGITRPQVPTPPRPDTIISPMKRSPHHYSVDCARAHKGLFVGILVLVLTIISLILFFVLISRPDFVALAVLEVTICELFIYATATIATLLGMIQIRHLQYDAFRSFSLDDILLVGAQTGSFLYNIFTVIAGHFSVRSDDWLVPINALASIVQTACQTMFILDAGRRQAVTPEHMRKKPGREIVTFMLVVNLAMWAISTLEKSRAESHPIQLNFYGLWAWTIITHVSMPLAIFYRFHSTVCLCEIWKRAYKLKPTFM